MTGSKFISMRTARAVLCLGACSASMFCGRLAWACGTDADCKGDRVCEEGECVDPAGTAPTGNEPDSVERTPPPPPAPSYVQDPPADVPSVARRNVHTHDGFYLRLGIGIGYLWNSTKVTANGYPGDIDFGITGIGGATEIAAGGTVAPGMVVGGGIYTLSVPSAQGKNYKFDGEKDEDTKSEWDTVSVFLVGPFLDYYLDPREGMHFQAAIGVANVQLSESSLETTTGRMDSDEESGTGFGLMLGVGLETWAGEQWSVGGLFRLQYTNATIGAELPTTRIEGDWETQTITPSLLFTATYH